MSDFLIVLSVALLGLLAQAAGGKRTRNLAYIAPDPGKSPAPATAQQGLGEFGTQKPINYPTEVPAVEPLAQPVTKVGENEQAGSLPDKEEQIGSGAAVESVLSEVAVDPVPNVESNVEFAEPTPANPSVDASTVSSDGSVHPLSSEAAAAEPAATAAAVEPGATGAASEPAATTSAAEPAVTAAASEPAAAIESDSTAHAPTPTHSGEAHLDATETPGAAGSILNAPSIKAAPEVPVAPKLQPPPVTQTSSPPAAAARSTEAFIVSRKPGIEYFLRATIFLWFLGLSLYFAIATSGLAPAELQAFDPWLLQVTFITCALTGFTLIKAFRTALSYVLSCVECIFDWSLLKASVKNWPSLKAAFAGNRVFIPSSIPHMVGLFIYIQTMFYLLAAMAPTHDFHLPAMPIPLPLPLDQLFSYNGLGLVTLAFCGCGIFVTRNFKEVLRRLALVVPTPPQIMIGLSLVVMSFLYDYLWSLYTHGTGQALDTMLTGYNGGTFTASGGFTGALILSLATAIFAGVGEETLIRGALQPVFGLVPAAILHGVLHAQFQHAPIFIVQVAGWSILMGIVKRYTNTSTTIIGHAGFNFVTSFLFSFNPPG